MTFLKIDVYMFLLIAILNCVMYENLDLWEIKTNSLFTCICESSEGLMDLVHVDMDSSDPPQRTITLFVMFF